jgi:hypothetical protein
MARLGDANWISGVHVTEAPVDHFLSRIALCHASLGMDMTLGIPIQSTHKSLIRIYGYMWCRNIDPRYLISLTKYTMRWTDMSKKVSEK